MYSEKETNLHNLLCVLNSLNRLHDAAFFLESIVETDDDNDDDDFFSELSTALSDVIMLHNIKLDATFVLADEVKPDGLIADNTLVEELIIRLERKLSHISRRRQLSRKS